MDEFQEKLTLAANSEETLMQVVSEVLRWDTERHKNNPSTKGLWKGHHDFMQNVSSFYTSNNYLSTKQRDSLVRTLSKYPNIVLPVLDNMVDSFGDLIDIEESLELIFDISEFEPICPNCGKPWTADNSEDTEMHASVFKCFNCGTTKYLLNNLNDKSEEI